MKYMVDHAAAEQLKAIAAKLGVLQTVDSGVASVGMESKDFGILLPGDQSTRGSGFVEGDKFDILSTCHGTSGRRPGR